MPSRGVDQPGQRQLAQPPVSTPPAQPGTERAYHRLITIQQYPKPAPDTRFPGRESTRTDTRDTLGGMSLLTSRIVIAVPADTVWDLVAHRFDRIGDWATAIPSSTAIPAQPAGPATAAPVAGRVCHTGLRRYPEVTESIVAYDDTHRTLTYEATAGMPAFVTTARNQWRVTALDDNRTEVAFTARAEVRGVLGRLAWWVLLLQVDRTGRHLLADLKYYVEHDTPSPRKRRALMARPS